MTIVKTTFDSRQIRFGKLRCGGRFRSEEQNKNTPSRIPHSVSDRIFKFLTISYAVFLLFPVSYI